MAEIGVNDYPSPTVRNFQKKLAYLIDCDEGLGSGFYPEGELVLEPELSEHVPPHCDLFFFFNGNNENILKRLEELKAKHSNVHVFPNASYGTEMNLSFVLGAINTKYDSFVIVTRYNEAFNGLKERLERTNSRLKNHVELRQLENPKEFTQHIRVLNKDSEEKVGLKVSSDAEPILFTTDSLFHRCPLDSCEESSVLYRFQELIYHLDHQHPDISYQYCPKCEQMIQEDQWTRNRRRIYKKHFEEEHSQKGFRLVVIPQS